MHNDITNSLNKCPHYVNEVYNSFELALRWGLPDERVVYKYNMNVL